MCIVFFIGDKCFVQVDLLAAKAPRVDTGEELVLNIVATVTNLSFYHHPNNVLYNNKQAILRRTTAIFTGI